MAAPTVATTASAKDSAAPAARSSLTALCVSKASTVMASTLLLHDLTRQISPVKGLRRGTAWSRTSCVAAAPVPEKPFLGVHGSLVGQEREARRVPIGQELTGLDGILQRNLQEVFHEFFAEVR